MLLDLVQKEKSICIRLVVIDRVVRAKRRIVRFFRWTIIWTTRTVVVIARPLFVYIVVYQIIINRGIQLQISLVLARFGP